MIKNSNSKLHKTLAYTNRSTLRKSQNCLLKAGVCLIQVHLQWKCYIGTQGDTLCLTDMASCIWRRASLMNHCLAHSYNCFYIQLSKIISYTFRTSLVWVCAVFPYSYISKLEVNFFVLVKEVFYLIRTTTMDNVNHSDSTFED